MGQPLNGNSDIDNAAATPGVLGASTIYNGMLGITTADGHAGVAGVCDEGKGNGVYGRSRNANGVIGFTTADGHAGVAGACDEGKGNGIYGRSKNGFAGFFEGSVFITGKLTANGIAVESLLNRIEQLENKLKNNTTRIGTRKIICANKVDPDSTVIPAGWIRIGRKNEAACQKQIGIEFNSFEIEFVGI